MNASQNQSQASVVITRQDFWIYGDLEVLLRTGVMGFRNLRAANSNGHPPRVALALSRTGQSPR